ncbi:hypothetical protein K502DRAFT_367715 [Neoconidiobolus thromboides FSU 785]|nr:hypothetical protein K502DRAFT_367715 [Neoconidiobolus thromboides FSU 785]
MLKKLFFIFILLAIVNNTTLYYYDLPQVRSVMEILNIKTKGYEVYHSSPTFTQSLPTSTSLSPHTHQHQQHQQYFSPSRYSQLLCSEKPILQTGCKVRSEGPIAYFFSKKMNRCLGYKTNNCLSTVFFNKMHCFSKCGGRGREESEGGMRD